MRRTGDVVTEQLCRFSLVYLVCLVFLGQNPAPRIRCQRPDVRGQKIQMSAGPEVRGGIICEICVICG
ncbi:MAG: hypothetical protein CVU64_13595 [Deltaproteobacteria bacterium HGW-Deltaproteobacteria-21]|nr:MAG: hypothetical protein CVU64_13595 [Deltaproteobacteria bacterium HGW-Deltaproteobacteria-21]